jgi:hypothetical protein
MSGLKWVKVVLSGARDKYGEIISKNFDSNKFNTKNKQNKSNQNQINLTEINQNKIKRNKFGFPFYQ